LELTSSFLAFGGLNFRGPKASVYIVYRKSCTTNKDE